MSETPTAEVAAGTVTAVAAAADLSDRAGYDPGFLAPGPVVPLPVPTDGTAVVVLPYTHFSVVLRPDRRLAAATAVTVDGAALRDVERGGDGWFLDPRVGPDAQAGADLYARNDFDRGHLVRRRDPVWGGPAEARRANADTFSYTNAAPQASGFNQSLELWLGLEDHVLAHARGHDARLVVLTGPVFADDDPEYRGVRVPRRFFKVAGYLLGGGATGGATGAGGPVLASAGFVLDQTPLVEEVLRSEAAAQHAPELGAFRTFQVPVADVAELTALDLGPLVAADRMPALVPAASAEGDGVPMWRPLTAPGELLL
ncbi:DNA/RNA non-specific endonuclease [Paenibacillus sp. TRM 82003]|uniref:DNA/RNA non-specific endonuclease n=1 Tax=Kineococcus sp. TRM81007 TaxID=2925831 RepID=UPI001F58756C|nr:DNA/RNA non-specific endonuclease [Kineococcus sp. TRM81007]MCI2238451.1 DNA/RNA non-specific endonuclease [Kineococcus sp. TRM81007]MCI3922035.1 DNA/RNA non-specific endonuclease [Paenibacillus sp. TRM 82003]